MNAEVAISPLGVFAAAFAASATAGIAAYLRSSKPISAIALITAGLNSGLLGLAISLLWYRKFQDNVYFLVGICVMTGLTGAAGLDVVLTAIQKGGFQIKLGNSTDEKGNTNLGLKIGSDEDHEK